MLKKRTEPITHSTTLPETKFVFGNNLLLKLGGLGRLVSLITWHLVQLKSLHNTLL